MKAKDINVGDELYLVDILPSPATGTSFGVGLPDCGIKYEILDMRRVDGFKFQFEDDPNLRPFVDEISWSPNRGCGRIPQVKIKLKSNNRETWMLPWSFEKENTFVHPFPNGTGFEDIDWDKYWTNNYHEATFIMMVGNGKQEYWDYDTLIEETAEFYLDEDYCDGCYAEDCASCDRDEWSNYEYVTKNKAVMGLRGTDSSCWGNGMPVIRTVQNFFGKCPDWMLLLFDNVSIWENVTKNSYEDIIKFYTYMMEAGAIPKNARLLKKEDEHEDCVVGLPGIDKMSAEKMYYMFCVLRTPVQHPGLVKLTNKLILERNMDPIMAYSLSQIMNPSFRGGHATITPKAMRYPIALSNTWDTPEVKHIYPRLDNLLTYTCRVVKLLDKDPGEKIKDCSIDYWQLDRTLCDGFDGFLRGYPRAPVNVRLSPNLKLTPDNYTTFEPRKRRVQV